MAAKENGQFLKPQNSVTNRHQIGINRQFFNFNLNQNHRCSQKNLSTVVHFNSKSNYAKNFGYTVTDPEKRKSWTKSKKDLCFKPSSNPYSNSETEKEGIRKRWKNDKNDNSEMKNNSTLSLHIAAYENSFDVSDESENSYSKNSRVSNFENSSTKFQAQQNFFEFPRQQENNEAMSPEIQQFQASQRLLSPNQDTQVHRRQPKPNFNAMNCILISIGLIGIFCISLTAAEKKWPDGRAGITTSTTTRSSTKVLSTTTPSNDNNDDAESDSTNEIIIGVSVGVGIFILLVIIIIVLCVIFRKKICKALGSAEGGESQANAPGSLFYSPQQFTHKGPLKIQKQAQVNVNTTYPDDKDTNPVNAHFVFTEAENEVYDIGSEVEQVI